MTVAKSWLCPASWTRIEWLITYRRKIMHKVLVLLAQGCEEIEAVTIIDILRRAGIEVTSAGLDDLPVLGSHGVMLLADTTLFLAPQQEFDMIVLPGGLPGTDNLRSDKRLIALLQKMAQQGKYIAAI